MLKRVEVIAAGQKHLENLIVILYSFEEFSKWAFFRKSLSIPCTCHLLVGLCSPPFSWAMKMAETKTNQKMARARHAG